MVALKVSQKPLGFMSCTAMSTIKICNHSKHNYTNQCLSECEGWLHTLKKNKKNTLSENIFNQKTGV